MKNKFPEAGRDRGQWLTWAQSVVDEAFQIDPAFMGECAAKIFGGSVWAWTADSTTDKKVHAICRAAIIVRLQSNLSQTLAILEIEKH